MNVVLQGRRKLQFIDFVVCVYLITINIHIISGSINAMLQNACYLFIIGYCIYKNHLNIYITPYTKHYGMFILWCVLSLLWTAAPSGSIQLLRILLKGYVVNIFLTQYYVGEDGIERFWKVAFVSLLIEIGYIMAVTPVGDWSIGYVGKRLGMDTVRFAMQTMLAACLAYFYWQRSHRICYLIIMGGLIVISLITGKRTGIIFLVCFLFAFYYHSDRRWNRRLVALLGGALLIIVLANIIYRVPVLYDTVGVRIDNMISTLTGNRQDDLSVIHRTILMERAWQSFMERPIIGYGLNSQRFILSSENFVQVTYAHNNMLEIGSGLGIVGIVLYYSIHGRICRNCLRQTDRRRDPYCLMILAMIAGFFVCDFVQVIYESYFENVILSMLLTGSIDSMERERMDDNAASE